MKLAKIFVGSPYNQKGAFNNVIERTLRLKQQEENVDCYIIRVRYGLLLRLLKRQFKKSRQEKYYYIKGMRFTNLWVTMGAIDYYVTHRLHLKPNIANRQLRKYAFSFQDYDLLTVHGYEAVSLASRLKKMFGVPFVVTWHGSDINFRPFHNGIIKRCVRLLLEEADHNFFVSKKLLDTAGAVSDKDNKSVLYTGPADIFYRYTLERKACLKAKYQITQKCAIGFVGNFVAVKNILILPEIFKTLEAKLRDVAFVLVGNGNLEDELKDKLKLLSIDNVYLLGKREPEEIPDILNCLDILLLPSFNEGLPRVALEAQACGVHVVASNRGGIPEAIGKENAFDLDMDFLNSVCERIVCLLNSNTISQNPTRFSWDQALKHEKKIHLEILNESY